MTVNGSHLAAYAHEHGADPEPVGERRAARYRFVGLVTDIRPNAMMPRVELQCGPLGKH